MRTVKEIVLIAVFIVIAGAFLYVMVGAVQSLISKDYKTVRESAEVTKKFEEDGAYKAEFSTSDSGALVFNVSKREFEALGVGQKGILGFRRDVFLGFDEDKIAETAEEASETSENKEEDRS